MHESQILDIIDSVTLGSLSDSDKSIIIADIKSENSNSRLAGNITSLVMQKITDLSNGMYKESQTIPKFDETMKESSPDGAPFKITNEDEINKFLEKMISKKFEGEFFNDLHNEVHPTDVWSIPGVPRKGTDFIIKS